MTRYINLGLNQRQIQRSLNPLNKSIREPVSASKRREVLTKARGKCQYPKCTIREEGYIKLDIHHKNMINSDNRISNLIALCKTHHGVMHRKFKVKHTKDIVGRRVRSRIVRTKPKKKTKRIGVKRKTNSPYNFGGYNFG
jgi:hypothetical protein